MRFSLVRVVALSLVLLLSACESNQPAPVIERGPQSKPAPPKPAGKPSATEASNKDWRPDSYVVKKGDTLFSIALQFGYDYKEIAAANNIAAPYPIKIGQKLNLSSLNPKTTATNKPAAAENEDGVVVSPIKTVPAATGTATETASTGGTPVLSEPKAVREAYSVEALNRKPVIAKAEETKASGAKPADTKPTESKPAEAKPAESKPAEAKPADAKASEPKTNDEENVAWGWPTQGKSIGNFNEATNKGIDIAGSSGQAISAAAAGKVIYVGSDLRGYGKLVIIKHNKTFLSVYAHNSKIIAKEGQTIAAGQKIAEMGNTDANTVKLHFEIRRQGKSVDPAKYLPQN